MPAPKATLTELVTPITRKEFEASMYAVMARFGLKTASWKPGAVVRGIVTALCTVLYSLSVVISLVARSGFLELSSGVWLRICAYFEYGVEAQTATFAAGQVRIDNIEAGSFDEAAGDMIFLGGNGQEYVNTGRVIVAAFETGVYVPVRATVAGSIGSAPAGTITRFGSNYPGLTVTNLTSIEALDDELDDLLKERARSETASISPNGPHEAYEAAAYRATRADGTKLNISSVRVVRGIGDGMCTVYAAGPSGEVPGTISDLSTDLGALHYALNDGPCPTGMTVTAASGTPATVDVTYTLWVYTTANLTELQVLALSNTALTQYISSRKLGGDRVSPTEGAIYLETIRATAMNAIPDQCAFRCQLNIPAADVACEIFTKPVVGTITGTVVLVNPNG